MFADKRERVRCQPAAVAQTLLVMPRARAMVQCARPPNFSFRLAARSQMHVAQNDRLRTPFTVRVAAASNISRGTTRPMMPTITYVPEPAAAVLVGGCGCRGELVDFLSARAVRRIDLQHTVDQLRQLR